MREFPAYEAQQRHPDTAPGPSSNSHRQLMATEAFICSLTHLQTLLQCQRAFTARDYQHEADHRSTRARSQLATKARRSLCESITGTVSAVPQNGTTVSVTASICKQCHFAEIGPPMGFHSTKNTINGFWPNLPMM